MAYGRAATNTMHNGRDINNDSGPSKLGTVNDKISVGKPKPTNIMGTKGNIKDGSKGTDTKLSTEKKSTSSGTNKKIEMLIKQNEMIMRLIARIMMQHRGMGAGMQRPNPMMMQRPPQAPPNPMMAAQRPNPMMAQQGGGLPQRPIM